MELTDLYIVGGESKKNAEDKDEWHRHKRGVIVRVSPQTNSAEMCVEYITPPEARPAEDPSILFKTGTLDNDKLYVCTQTEVLIYALPHFEQIGYVSLPCFNDLHHVLPTPEGNMLVTVTGLDMVVEVTPQGEILREWGVLGQDPWSRFSREVDYRRVVTTKPHEAHPNHTFRVGEDIWVTRFEQRDAICLTQPDQRIEIGVQRPHDGAIYEGSVYFTTVDGHIIVASLENNRVEQVIDLNEITNSGWSLGWCRGLHIVDKEHIIIGFTRVRPTKIRENVRWIKHRFGLRETAGKLPARIALYNIKERKLCWEQNLEDAGMNVVFSIHSTAGQVQ